MPHARFGSCPFSRQHRSLWWFLFLVLALTVAVAVTATFMSTRSAERSMRTAVERRLYVDTRDNVEELVLWYSGLQTQMERLASTNVFRMFAIESQRLAGESCTSDPLAEDESAQPAEKNADIPPDVAPAPPSGTAAVPLAGVQTPSPDAMQQERRFLLERIPFVRALMQDFAGYTGFLSGRMVNASMQDVVATYASPAPLTKDQIDALRRAFATGKGQVTPVRHEGETLLLDVVQPVQAPQFAAEEQSAVPPAALLFTRTITPQVRTLQQASAEPGSGLYILQYRDDTWQNVLPDQPTLHLDAEGWELDGDRLPLAVRNMPEQHRQVYAMGLPVPKLQWLLVRTVNKSDAEADFRERSGHILFIAAGSTVVALLLLGTIWWLTVGLRDQTLRRETEELHATVHRQSQLLARIDDALPAGLVLTDANGHILHVNNGFALMLGHAPKALPGVTLVTLFPHDMAKRLHNALTHVLQSGETEKFTHTLPLPGWTGDELRTCRVICSPFTSPDGELTGVVAVFQDLTDELLACSIRSAPQA